jgi:hypothetical protein
VHLPRYWLTIPAAGIALGARASACYSVQEYEKRLACLAEEPRDPSGCTSIRDWDDREKCRQRAPVTERGEGDECGLP